jgi:hypothetical protein
MTRKLFPLAAAILASSLILIAQNPSQSPQQPVAPPKAAIEGTVTRAGSGQPLKGVQVTVQKSDAAGAGTTGRGGNRGAAGAGAAGIGALGDLLNAFAGGGRGNRTVVTTDSAGHFEVTGLDAGPYQITADREGLIRQEYGRRTTGGRGTSITVASGQHFIANFQMDAAGVIAGRVRDSSGEPIFRATVQAYTYQYSNGDRTLAQVATIQTDDLGQYRLFPLSPGDYFLSVTAQPESTGPSQVDAGAVPAGGARGAGQFGGLQNNPILQALTQQASSAPFFYPGTIDPDAAAAIHVAASAEVRDINLNLRPVPGVTVSGRLVAPFSLAQNAGRGQQPANPAGGILNILAGGAAQNAQVSLTRIGSARAGFAALFGRLNQVRVGTDGAFEIRNVAPGSYDLNAAASDSGQRYTGRIRVDVAASDISTATVEVHPGVEVRGQIIVDNPPSQFKMSQVRVSLVEPGTPAGDLISTIGSLIQGAGNAGGRGGRGGTGGANATPQVAEDGTFTLSNVASSVEYRVTISNASGGYLLDGRIGANDALGSTFTVEQGAVLQLRIGFSTGRVSGTVVDAGKLFAGAQVVLVPDPPRRGRNDMYFSMTSDANGAFNFGSVPVGSYRMFAWEDVPAGAYQYPEFLRPYEPVGVPVRVEQGGGGGGELKLIPATTG